MSFIRLDVQFKRYQAKPDGKKELIMIVDEAELRGHMDDLDQLHSTACTLTLESKVVKHIVRKDAKTNQPITTYKVDNTGVVSEVQPPEGEQLEADLGIPKPPQQVVEEKEIMNVDVVDDFIEAGMAPTFPEYKKFDFPRIIQRKRDGETYLRMAQEMGIPSGQFVDAIDEYRVKIAGMAKAWDEWRRNKPVLADNPEPEQGEAQTTEPTPEVEQDTNEPTQAEEANEPAPENTDKPKNKRKKDEPKDDF